MNVVCAGVILRSGAVLLARRGPAGRHPGKWEFPGGRVEAGETPAAALARELKEELGLDAEVGAELTRVRHGGIELVAFLVPRFSGAPAPTVHDELKWVEPRRLLEFDLLPADVPVAEAVAAHRRRDRYTGTHPRRFSEKYKELSGDPEAVAKAKARGSTPAGAHLSIMVPEALSALAPLSGATVLDCTLGWGGHAEALARAGAEVVALDRDGEELARTEARLRAAGLSVRTVRTNYAGALKAVTGLGLSGVDAVLADFGVSSMQLDRPERGMSFKADGPLDMRMDRSRGKTAAEWLRGASEAEVFSALSRFGQEPDAKAVAAELEALRRAGRTPKTTGALVKAVARAKRLGAGRVVKKDAFSGHPAARTFQAVRIAVNAELDALAQLLRDLPYLLNPGGRAALLTFHSLEESLVREHLERQTFEGLWREAPAEPVRASGAEVRENPRARSARLWRAVRA